MSFGFFTICRIMYRKRRAVMIFLSVALFWVLLIYLSLPSATQKQEKKKDTGVTEKVIHSHNVYAIDLLGDRLNKKPVLNVTSQNYTFSGSRNLSNTSTNASTSVKPSKNKKDMLLNFGERLKNKTLEVGAKFKNKTLEKLSNLGIIRKINRHTKINRPSALNITMSQDEFLYIIKTLMKKSELDNVTRNGNSSLTMLKRSNGTENETKCDCYYMHCLCCVQLQLPTLKMNVRKACSNITFIPKSHELLYEFQLDGKEYFNSTIPADSPPLICLGSHENVFEICTHFSNITFNINTKDNHKTQLRGCMDFRLNVYGQTVSSFTFKCFQIPSDDHIEKDNRFQFLGNWVP